MSVSQLTLVAAVGSLAFEKIVHENRALRHERELLNQKLGKSKVITRVN